MGESPKESILWKRTEMQRSGKFSEDERCPGKIENSK